MWHNTAVSAILIYHLGLIEFASSTFTLSPFCKRLCVSYTTPKKKKKKINAAISSFSLFEPCIIKNSSFHSKDPCAKDDATDCESHQNPAPSPAQLMQT